MDDRFKYGFDAGNIIDGEVKIDNDNIFIIEEDGNVFNVSEAFKSLCGKRVRTTLITFEALDGIEQIYADSILNRQD